MKILLIVTLGATLCACGPRDASPPSPVDGWLGTWKGPEGTSLTLERSAEEYAVEIRNLDGPKTFDGKAVGDHLEFVRNDTLETLRATDGPGTGMKWLQGKKDCLVVIPGEGWCRD